MPVTNKIVRLPFEKALKNFYDNDSVKFSKNIKYFEEKELEGKLFPANSKTPEKLSFVFDPRPQYISFRQDVHLSIYGQIKVICNPVGANDVVDQKTKKTFMLNEKMMNMYLNSGINKFIRNVKCTFNNNTLIDCSTLSFQDFNTFDLYHAIESSLLKESDPLKASNQNLDILSQFELSKIKELIDPEGKENVESTENYQRLFQTTLPLFPLRKLPPFYKNRINSTLSSVPNSPTVSIYLTIIFFCLPPPILFSKTFFLSRKQNARVTRVLRA